MKLRVYHGSHEIANLDAVHTREEQTVTVTDLFVHPLYRRKGIGSWAMWWLMRWVYAHLEDGECHSIEWADCSDRSRKPRNVYKRLGATYKKRKNDPDMKWSVARFGFTSIRMTQLMSSFFQSFDNIVFVFESD